MFTDDEMQKIEHYLQQLFWNPEIKVTRGLSKTADAPVEVFVGKEFIGVIYKNEEEGEISYDWNMSILKEDMDNF